MLFSKFIYLFLICCCGKNILTFYIRNRNDRNSNSSMTFSRLFREYRYSPSFSQVLWWCIFISRISENIKSQTLCRWYAMLIFNLLNLFNFFLHLWLHICKCSANWFNSYQSHIRLHIETTILYSNDNANWKPKQIVIILWQKKKRRAS